MTCLEKRVNILIFPWFYFSTVKKFGLTKKGEPKSDLALWFSNNYFDCFASSIDLEGLKEKYDMLMKRR